MATTIYQFFMMRPSEAWYQLSKEEQDKLLAVDAESSEKAGSKLIIFSDSAWSNEEWLYLGVKEYPNLESLQEHTKRLEAVSWFRYMNAKVILGKEWEGNF